MHRLAKEWRVVIADVNQTHGNAVAQELGNNVLFVKTDVSKWDEQSALFRKAFTWGDNRLDFFAANAGIADRQSIYELTKDAEVQAEPMPLNLDALKVDLDAVIQGIWLFVHYARRNKNPGGKVVITSSAAGLYPMETCPQYSAAKHAVSVTRHRQGHSLPSLTSVLSTDFPNADLFSRLACWSYTILGPYLPEGGYHR